MPSAGRLRSDALCRALRCNALCRAPKKRCPRQMRGPHTTHNSLPQPAETFATFAHYSLSACVMNFACLFNFADSPTNLRNLQACITYTCGDLQNSHAYTWLRSYRSGGTEVSHKSLIRLSEVSLISLSQKSLISLSQNSLSEVSQEVSHKSLRSL